MAQTTVTRIRLPTAVHRRVKAAAVLHDLKTDQALGECVTYLVGRVEPLSWLAPGPPQEPLTEEKGA